MAIYDYQGNIIPVGGSSEPHLTVPWKSSMHRGYSSSTVHENTLEAFYRAYLNGADWIEVDARLSSDGVYISNHDATVTVGGTTYTIANETAETLTSLVLSVDPIYGDCHIPTLESILKMAAYTGLSVNVDCKEITASTLAKLVVDCGMSGRVAYANTNTSNAATILNIDPNAGFIFSYGVMSQFVDAISDYHVRQKSYAWSSSISTEALENTRAYGFKYLVSETNGSNYTQKMSYVPDMVEFQATVDSKTLNQNYLNSLDFGL